MQNRDRRLDIIKDISAISCSFVDLSAFYIRLFRTERLLLRNERDWKDTRFRFLEEWETRKKKEITTTRQIETRVKRQVVLEDGEVVVDSGPLVTTNTTEDVEQQEHTTQEVCTYLLCECSNKIQNKKYIYKKERDINFEYSGINNYDMQIYDWI